MVETDPCGLLKSILESASRSYGLVHGLTDAYSVRDRNAILQLLMQAMQPISISHLKHIVWDGQQFSEQIDQVTDGLHIRPQLNAHWYQPGKIITRGQLTFIAL